MSPDLQDALVAGGVGLCAWFIKDLLFGDFRRRAALERQEWEYRLKEVYCPLYYWSGLLRFDVSGEERRRIAESLNGVMARAAYVVPEAHFRTLVQLIESAYGQPTSGASSDALDKARAHLHGHIAALNALLYRLDGWNGIGDPAGIFEPVRRAFRLVLIWMTHLLVWAFLASVIAAVLLVPSVALLDVAGFAAILLLAVMLVNVRQRRRLRDRLRELIGPR